ncbi:DLW-39 family protein [Actinopolymorpha sp. B17G11]
MSKKLLLVVLAVLGGWLAYRRLQADKAEESLWAEATDTVPPAGGVR